MRTRILIAFLVAVVLALTGVTILMGNANANLSARVQFLSARVEFLERQAQIRQLVERLAVPEEAVYWDLKTSMPIAKLRLQLYKELGVREYIQYGTIQASIRSRFPLPNESSGGAVSSTFETAPVDYYPMGSFEDSSLAKAIQAADQVAADIKGGARLGPYFKNVAEFDLYLRPYLTRLLRCGNPWLALAACKVFVAYGERTEELRNVLTRLANSEYRNNGTAYKEDGQRLLKKAGWTYQPLSKPSVTTDPAKNPDGTTH